MGLPILVEFPPKIKPHFISEWKYAKYVILGASLFSMWSSLLHSHMKDRLFDYLYHIIYHLFSFR